MSNDLAVQNFSVLQQQASAMASSGFFADAKSEAQAIVKIMAGAELGLGPFAAMSGIHIIKGKPALGANLIATLIKNDARYNYKVLEHDATVCTIQFYENGEVCGNSEFTVADAQKAGTQNMAKFPKNMLFARAISNGAKWYTPGIFGGAPVYTPEELGMNIDGEGEIIVDSVFIESDAEIKGTSVGDSGVVISMLSGEKLKELNTVGSKKYGKEWNTKRPDLVKAITKSRATGYVLSSKELTTSEADDLLTGMSKLVDTVSA
jgi:hypothetical protein